MMQVRKYILARITRVPQCLSPRRSWDPPPPLPQASVYPSESMGGGAHSPAGEWVGEVPIRTTGKAWHSVYSVVQTTEYTE